LALGKTKEKEKENKLYSFKVYYGYDIGTAVDRKTGIREDRVLWLYDRDKNPAWTKAGSHVSFFDVVKKALPENEREKLQWATFDKAQEVTFETWLEFR
jgi:hypothetical protein